MSRLFTPLVIKSVRLKNRIVVSPMCQYSAKEGYSNDWHIVHLGSRSVGGAALVFVEATAVSPEGRITPGDLGLWDPGHVAGLKRIADFVHGQGAVAGIQIAHAGRKASCAAPWDGGRQLDASRGGWQTVAPGDIPYHPGEIAPGALDAAGIDKIISDFKVTASRALEAGFRILEIHSAHGYLIHEFLSPVTNHRTDQYGGSFENRTRLLLRIVDGVRSQWPEKYPLFVRISSTDWIEGGWDIDEAVKLAFLLKEKEVDLIDCSSGGIAPDIKVPTGPGYQVRFSEAIRKTGILTGAVGFITTAVQAESILREDKADLIFLAREMLRNPYFPLLAARELGDDIPWAVQYLRAKP